MALFTKKEFCQICGIKSNQLSVHIGRGDIVMSTNLKYLDHIDGDNAKTKWFVTKRTARKKSAKQKAERLVGTIAGKYRLSATDIKTLAKDFEDCINEAADDVLKHMQYLRIELHYV